MTVAQKLVVDLSLILSQAEKHGALARLKQVAIYFTEAELRTIVRALSATHL